MKFCILTHIGHPNPKRSSKTQILKIQDGGQPPFLKMLNVISQQRLFDFGEIWYGDAY